MPRLPPLANFVMRSRATALDTVASFFVALLTTRYATPALQTSTSQTIPTPFICSFNSLRHFLASGAMLSLSDDPAWDALQAERVTCAAGADSATVQPTARRSPGRRKPKSQALHGRAGAGPRGPLCSRDRPTAGSPPGRQARIRRCLASVPGLTCIYAYSVPLLDVPCSMVEVGLRGKRRSGGTFSGCGAVS